MLTIAACCLALLGSAAAARQPDAAATRLRPDALEPEPPVRPNSYSVNYTFTLPYTARIQQPAISYQVAFYRDAEGQQSRMDTYNSTQIMIAKMGKTLELVPRIDRLVCLVVGDDGGSQAALHTLPAVTGWQWAGLEHLNGEEVFVWQYEARHEGKQVVYRFFVAAADGATPRRLHMHGNDLISGAHFDEWVVDYSHYAPGQPDAQLFHTPALCKHKQAIVVAGRSGSQLRWAALAPSVRYSGDAQYDVFLGSHGSPRSHASLADYRRRRDIFHSHRQLIEAHNAAEGRSFTLAMNRFGDLSDQEFLALMLPKHAARQAQRQPHDQLHQQLQETQQTSKAAQQVQQVQQAPLNHQAPSERNSLELEGEGGEGCGGEKSKRHSLSKHEVPHVALTDAARLPASLTWRGTGADSVGVKDQATCGSCWSFAATGTMEGAWFRATGSRVDFSEQQILDCSWGYKPKSPEANLACDGGDPEAALGYVVEAGGIAANADYPYKGQDGYCLTNSTRLTGRFKGFARVPRCDDAALKEALYSRGPLAISFDASRPSFRFYSHGVYADSECLFKPGQLDHSMVLVGYGTGAAGEYWEVKNSWSTHWGDGGYFKVARDVRHACGVASDASYAVVADGVAAE